jgi:tetratricopeptide (TPR) repeat protein
MSRRRVWACAVLVLAVALPSLAQAPPPRTTPSTPRTFGIRGSLRFASNNAAAEMIKIELKRFTGETVSVTYTRSNGEFEFGNLETGQYIITVREEGYELLEERVELMHASRTGVFIFLREPLQIRHESQGGATVSARELALSPKAAEALRKGRRELYDQNDPADSLKHFKTLAKEAPAFYEAHYYQGFALFKLGRTDEAEQSLRKAIEMSEEAHGQSLLALASLLSNGSRFTEAEVVARKALRVDPDAWQGHYELARALVGLNQLTEAIECLNLVYSKRPDYPEQFLLAANIFMRRQDPYGLLKAFDGYLKTAPTGAASDDVRRQRRSLVDNMTRAGLQVPAEPPPQ